MGRYTRTPTTSKSTQSTRLNTIKQELLIHPNKWMQYPKFIIYCFSVCRGEIEEPKGSFVSFLSNASGYPGTHMSSKRHCLMHPVIWGPECPLKGKLIKLTITLILIITSKQNHSITLIPIITSKQNHSITKTTYITQQDHNKNNSNQLPP